MPVRRISSLARLRRRMGARRMGTRRVKSVRSVYRRRVAVGGRARLRRTSVPVARGYTMSKSGRVGYRTQQVSATRMRIIGRSYLGSVDNLKLANEGGNAICGAWDVNPSLLGDRVSVIASTYEKYVFKRMTFTYVPQCGTSQVGSVGIVYERDPSQVLACPDASGYLAQIMSYENATLTPAWKEVSCSFSRKSGEKELYWIGGPNGQNDPRHFSQGLLITYGCGTGAADANLGYIVMDYVLELDTPTIIPSRNGVNMSGLNAPSQYRKLVETSLVDSALKKIKIGDSYYGKDFLPAFDDQSEIAAGSIYELILEKGKDEQADELTLYSVENGGKRERTFTRGDRLYLVAQVLYGETDASCNFVINVFPTLPAAWSACGDAAEHVNTAPTSQIAYGDTAGAGLFALWGPAGDGTGSAPKPSITGYYRCISRGNATSYAPKV